ncbi:MAG: prolyl oligopeptidase family serine peptidase, partial [Verrucomicrobiota bacterium]
TGLTAVTRSRAEGGVSEFALSRDGRSLYYAVSIEESVEEWKDLRNEFAKEVEFGSGNHYHTELIHLDLVTWRERSIHSPGRYLRSLDVSPDGKRIAMLSDPDSSLVQREGFSRVDILELENGTVLTLPDGQWREEAPSPYGWLEELSWAPSGKHLAFSIFFDGYPAEVFLASYQDNGDLSTRKLVRPDEIHLGSLGWKPNGAQSGEDLLCVVGDYHATKRIYGIDPSDPAKSGLLLDQGEVTTSDFSFSDDGETTVILQSGKDYANDLFAASGGDELTRLTRVNPQVDSWILPQVSRYSWMSEDGTELEGILELPPGYDLEAEDREPLPLIVAIHGGPASSDQLAFRYWIYGRTLFASKGYALFAPNYRGSIGYGDKFMTDLIGRKNDVDVTDILTGVDQLVGEGIADPERLGAMGWSNGGFLTNCLLATNRFRAASSGAGVFDSTIQWSEEDTPGHVVNYSKGLPWEQPATYQRASPLYSLRPGLETATLIHVGENDARVPVTHSRALHRTLSFYLDVPTELLVYPGAGHTLTKYRHRLAKLEWDHAWFDHYLLKSE